MFMETITEKQKVIYDLITKEFLTIKQISLSLKMSKQHIHRVIKVLVKKGYIFYDGCSLGDARGVAQNQRSSISPPFEKDKSLFSIGINKGLTQCVFKSIRLHNQHFTIRILNKGLGYDRFRSRVSSFKLEGNTVKLNDSNVEVYSNQSFIGSSPEEAHKRSLEFWYIFFARLQSDLKVILIKDGFDNIKECRSHYAEVDNEFAKDLNSKKEKLSISGLDGKEYLKVDNSFNLNELETVHPVLSKEDMSKVKYFFDDLRSSEKSSFSDVKSLLIDVARVNKETADGLGVVVDTLKLLVKPKDKEDIIWDDGLNKKIPDYIN